MEKEIEVQEKLKAVPDINRDRVRFPMIRVHESPIRKVQQKINTNKREEAIEARKKEWNRLISTPPKWNGKDLPGFIEMPNLGGDGANSSPPPKNNIK